jgi:RNA recognition motif-containing protein
MGSRLYVGNLPFSATEDQVRELFEEFGSVDSVHLVTDRETGRPRGFAFAELGSDQEADAAIQQMDGMNLDGRPLRVNEAQERPRR